MQSKLILFILSVSVTFGVSSQILLPIEQPGTGEITGPTSPEKSEIVEYTYDGFLLVDPKWKALTYAGNYTFLDDWYVPGEGFKLRMRWNKAGNYTLVFKNGSTELDRIEVQVVRAWFRDNDGDGYGNPNVKVMASSQPSGYVSNNKDCNDSNASIKDAKTWYVDNDGDGYGGSSTKIACSQPNGYVGNNSDCNDNDASIYQEQAWYLDADNDGVGNQYPTYSGGLALQIEINGNFYPLAIMSCGKPIMGPNYELSNTDCNDNDASLTTVSTWYQDNDGDGFGSNVTISRCGQPLGYVNNNLDCNDSDATVTPNTVWYADSDGDGFGNPNISTTSCNQPTGYVLTNDDCNDNDPVIHPETIWYPDNDGDGFGVIVAPQSEDLTVEQEIIPLGFGCTPPSNGNYVTNTLDCDDYNPAINPNTIWYEDNDGDGYGNSNISFTGIDCETAALNNYSLVGEDCNDDNPNYFEAKNWYADSDGDGEGDANSFITACVPPADYVLTAYDCNDSDPLIGRKVWYLDQDQDGIGNASVTVIQCSQPDGYAGTGGDCDDNDPNATIVMTWYPDTDGDGYGDGFITLHSEDLTELESLPYEVESCAPHFEVKIDGDTVHYVTNNMDCFVDDPDKYDLRLYIDRDNDGYGDINDPGEKIAYESCSDIVAFDVPSGYAANNTDANDYDSKINPGTKWFIDQDDDGFGVDGPNTFTGNYPPNDGNNYVTNDLDICPTTFGKFSGCKNLNLNLSNENYVLTRTLTTAIPQSEYVFDAETIESRDEVNYVDGLGRTIQSNYAHASPSFNDIVSFHQYDDAGREQYQYLPYTNDLSGAYDAMTIENQENYYKAFYGDSIAFTYTNYSDGPLDRVLSKQLPGVAWKNDDARINYTYDLNHEQEVIYLIHDSLYSDLHYYQENELFKIITYDEDSAQTIEYTNQQGQTILKKSQVDGSTWAETYYIYDVYGNLAVVLPPEATNRLDSEFFGQNQEAREDLLNTWAFLYDYDGRNRMTMKKAPGADSVFMVYDQWDRLVLTQDGNQRTANKWLFTKYDALNRPIMTGIMNGGSESAERAAVEAETDRYETLNGTGTIQYSDVTYPSDNLVEEYLTVTYYDNYNFQSHANWVNAGLSFTNPTGLTENNAVKGQVTGTMTKAGDGSWIYSASYYDDKYRMIQSQSTNHLNGKDVVTNYYDFIGQVDKTITEHSDETKTTTITRTFEYDHAGRLLKTWHQLDTGDPILVAENRYNELGELIEKDLHQGTGGTFAQSLDYAYNIRGWLTRMNQSDLSASPDGDLFGMELHYHTNPLDNTKTYFNGNIGGMAWSNTDANGEGINDRAYTFQYDKLNRLTDAQHYQDGVSNADNPYDVSIPEYDLNGNIKSLQRRAESVSAFMDNLDYEYVGNQLQYVNDLSGDTLGFNNGSTGTNIDYTYDANGNMISDANKGITNIEYNHLNLPTAVILSTSEGSGRIEYLYDAAGIKLQQKVYKDGNLVKTTDYVGEFIYETDSTGERKLQLIQHEEGRLTPPSGGGQGEDYDYQYHLKDHLGNVRVTFSTTPENYTMVETFETGEENGWQDLHRHTNTDANTTVYEDESVGDEVELLQSGQTGAMIFLSVNKRDTIHLSVQANYESAPSGNNFLGTAFNALFTSFDNVYGSGVPEGGGVSSSSTTFDNALGGAEMGGKDDASTAPRAFLNYIYFDKDMNYVRAGFAQVSTAAQGVGVHEELRIDDIIADKEGYILAYLSNENQEAVNVHFDDFTVYHGKTNVVSTQDYYPGGGFFNSYTRTASTAQNYKFNGNEWQPEWSVYDFNARFYDPWGGPGFLQVDPMAEEREWLSPYNFAQNNPVNRIDPTGLLDDIYYRDGEEVMRIVNDKPDRYYEQRENADNVSGYETVQIQNPKRNPSVLQSENKTGYVYSDKDVEVRTSLLSLGSGNIITAALLRQEEEGNFQPVSGQEYRDQYVQRWGTDKAFWMGIEEGYFNLPGAGGANGGSFSRASLAGYQKGLAKFSKELSNIKRPDGGFSADFKTNLRNSTLPKNQWNRFQKANRGRFRNPSEASKEYKRIMTGN